MKEIGDNRRKRGILSEIGTDMGARPFRIGSEYTPLRRTAPCIQSHLQRRCRHDKLDMPRSMKPKLTAVNRSVRSQRSLRLCLLFVLLMRGAATVAVAGDPGTPPYPTRHSLPNPAPPDEQAVAQHTLDGLLFGELKLGGPAEAPGPIYVGQEVPLRITIYARTALDPRFDDPEVTIEHAAFADYSAVNPSNPRFARPERETRTIDGHRYVAQTFTMRFRPQAKGPLMGSVVVSCRILDIGSGARQPDAPFDSRLVNEFFGRPAWIRHDIKMNLPRFDVRELPSAPAGAHSLGLVGQWDLDLEFTPADAAVGQPLTMQLHIKGTGSIETLRAPSLALEGFRVYEPEVQLHPAIDEASGRITWALVALRTDAALPQLGFTTFDPDKGAYRVQLFDITIDIQPGAVPDHSAPAADAQDSRLPDPEMHRRLAAHRAGEIRYVRTRLPRDVRLPLWRNVALRIPGLIAFGLAAYLFLATYARHRYRMIDDTAYRRRRSALRQRRRIVKRLHDAAPGERAAVVRNDVTPYLNAMLELPPGTTASDLADRLEPRDPEFAAMLRSSEHGCFAPVPNGEVDVKAVIRKVRQFSLVLLCMWATAAHGAVTPEQIMHKATAAYDVGEYAEAMELYGRLERIGVANPGLLYNRANCAFHLGDLPLALAYLERARRLAPRDRAIIENLGIVRQRLGLAPVFDARNPAALARNVRDLLRPDEWLLLAACTVALGGLGAGLLRVGRRSLQPLVVPAALLVLLCFAAYRTQMASTYRRHGHGVIADSEARAYRIPQPEHEHAAILLNAGTPVTILGTRPEWARITVDGTEVWVRRTALLRIW